MHAQPTVENAVAVARTDRARTRGMVAPRIVAHVAGKLLIGLDRFAGQFLLFDEAALLQLAGHLTNEAEPFDHRREVFGAGPEVAEVDQWRVAWISRVERDVA